MNAKVQLPERFQETMRALLGDEYEQFLESYWQPAYNGIRLNTLKISPEAYMALTGTRPERVPWNDLGFYCGDVRAASRNPLYYAGLYYIQEPSAMLPAALLPVSPGERVLDLCAAPGGKSTALGARLGGEGLLVSNDISYSRAKALLRNIEAFGIRNCLVISETPEKLAQRLPKYFDKILIDAPCSGEGMFRKKPSMTESWEKTGPEYYSGIQREIICRGADMLRPGGRMVYSTCTFSPLEDEGTVAYFLERHPEFSLEREIRLWPHRVKGEGHYAALLKKAGEAGMSAKAPQQIVAEGTGMSAKAPRIVTEGMGMRPSDSAMDIFFEFLRDAKITRPFDARRLRVVGDHLYELPETMIDLAGLRVLRCGWYLGNIKKQRFEPSGALAMGLSAKECGHIVNYSHTDAEAVKYLKCETLEVDESLEDGWYLVCVDHFPLGFGKVSRGVLKNKYPAGWRWQT